MGFYKLAYWFKSGPFLVGNLSMPIRGHFLLIRRKKNLQIQAKFTHTSISEFTPFRSFYKVAIWS
jgi:hypothetical protein